MPAVEHRCTPGQWCALCVYNVKVGGDANHTTNLLGPLGTTARAKKEARDERKAMTRFPGVTGPTPPGYSTYYGYHGPTEPNPAGGVCSQLQRKPLAVAGSHRAWMRCAGGRGSTAAGVEGLVTTCQTPQAEVWRLGPECGPTCAGFTPDPLPRWLPVPDPDYSPKLPRVVATIVIGEDAEEMHKSTGPSQKRYADRIGAEFLVIRGKTQDDRMACAEKWRYRYVVGAWEESLLVDADVFIDKSAPDIFDHCPPDACGMVDVLPNTPNLAEWYVGILKAVCESQGVPLPPPAHRYWNSGVWVGRTAQADYWTPPAKPYPIDWCVEEIWCRAYALSHGIRIHDLNPRFNWTWIQDRAFAGVHEFKPWFWHLAGMGNPQADNVKEWKQNNKTWRLALLRLMSAMSDDAGG